MKVVYTGQPVEFTAAQKKKLDAHWAKLAKLVDRRTESSLHVIFSVQRHQTKAELTLRHAGQDVVAKALAADPFQALREAAATVEQTILKRRAKIRDTRRVAAEPPAVVVAEPPLRPRRIKAKPAPPVKAQVRRVTVARRQRPMTAEEALLAMGDGRNYLPFQDADTGAISVLIRREDGRFDLVET